MRRDDADILKIFQFELSFLEEGGYGRSPRAPWRASYVFEDSPTCLNFSSSAYRISSSTAQQMGSSFMHSLIQTSAGHVGRRHYGAAQAGPEKIGQRVLRHATTPAAKDGIRRKRRTRMEGAYEPL